MGNENNRKILVFYVLEILKENTDENHLLTYNQIVNLMQKKYNVKPNVKSIATSIDTLVEAGYEVVRNGFKGCYLSYRDFDSGELMYLVDAIYSSTAIPGKQAKELIERLTKNCSKYEKKKYNSVQKIDEISKNKNKELFFVIEQLSQAIENKKKVSFHYNEYKITKELKERREGKEFIINPYFMVNSRGKYYLVCNYDKYNSLSNYKVECISNVKILDEPIKPIRELNDTQDFTMAGYIKDHIYMTNGSSVKATLLLDDEKRISDVIDWFGEQIKIREDKNGIIVELTANEPALIYWSLQYGEHIKVVAPETTKNKIKDMLKEMLKKYDN